MKVLLIGAGGVGEAIAIIAQDKPWLKKMVLADYNVARLKEVSEKLNDSKKFPVEQLDARNKKAIVKLARDYNVDLIMNAVDPTFACATGARMPSWACCSWHVGAGRGSVLYAVTVGG